MLIPTKEILLEIINRAIPYSEQIEEWDFSEENVVRFTWRGNRFRVTNDLFVESVTKPFLRGDNISILLERVLKLVWIDYDRKKKVGVVV